MTFPANLNLEAAPYGPQPVLPVGGPQGGPYSVQGPSGQVLLPSASRTATIQLSLPVNYQYRGIYLYWNVSVNPGGAQTLALTLSGIEPVAGNLFTLLSVPASATPGGVFLLYPGLSGAAIEGVAQTRNLVLPSAPFLQITHSGVGAWTYYVGGIFLP